MNLLSENLKEAIRAQDSEKVTGWLTLAKQTDELHWNDPSVVMHAVIIRNLNILKKVVAYPWHGSVLASGYALAVEKEWKEEAQLLLAGSECKRFDDNKIQPTDVLREAARKGWLRPIDHVMAQHPSLLSAPIAVNQASDQTPLFVAIENGKMGVLSRLLQEKVALPVLAESLMEAVVMNNPSALALLWPRVGVNERGEALYQMAVSPHYDQVLSWVMQTFTSQDIRSQWSQNDGKRFDSLVQSIRHGRIDLVKVLLPLIEPKTDKSAPLRAAVEHDHPELIALLLPLSDPKAARQAWLRKVPSQWEWVDRLGVHLPPDQQAAWCTRPEHMPQLTALRRAAQTSQEAPSPVRRSRLRS